MRKHGKKATERRSLVERALNGDARDGWLHFRDRFDWSRKKTASIANAATGYTLTFNVWEVE